MDVLPNEGIAEHVEHFLERQRDVVPFAILEDICDRMPINVLLDVLFLIIRVVEIYRTIVTSSRYTRVSAKYSLIFVLISSRVRFFNVKFDRIALKFDFRQRA